MINLFFFLCVECLNGSNVVDVVVLCHAIKNSMSITSLNFTGCGLSAKAAEVLAETIKVL